MIQDRYWNTLQTKVLSNGRVVYMSALPRPIYPNLLTDPYITAGDTVRMDVIAQGAYGSPHEWWRLAAANLKVNGSLYFRPGTQIVIPRR